MTDCIIHLPVTEAVQSLISHIANKSNPHEVTAEQVGLGNVENVVSSDLTPDIDSSAYGTPTTGDKLSAMLGKIVNHITNYYNPHKLTIGQLLSDYLQTISVFESNSYKFFYKISYYKSSARPLLTDMVLWSLCVKPAVELQKILMAKN